MISQVRERITKFWGEKGPFKKVLDVGSLNVNGSIKELLDGYEEFIGIDMREGDGADFELHGSLIDTKWPEPYFDVVFCLDTLEHDPKFWLTVEQMRKVLKPGGYLFIAVPSFFHPRHDHPSDYYRFLETTFFEFMLNGFVDADVETLYWSGGASHNMPDEIIGYGRKPL